MAADNPADIKVNAKVSANFDPLIKATPKGLGRLFSLAFDKREADNLRYKMLLATQTQKECEQILSGERVFENGHLIPVVDSENAKSWSILQIEAEQEGRNLAGNILMAAEALKDTPDEQVSDKKVDEDFFARWRREAKVIGNEVLQRLWGRLLAEEIKNPNNISLRVLDTLKNISSDEAKLFQRLAPYCCASDVMICGLDAEIPVGFSFDDYLLLLECGLLLNVDTSLSGYSTDIIVINGKEYVEVEMKDVIIAVDIDKKEVTIPGAALSSSGKMALQICDFDKPSLDVIKYCSKVINTSDSNPINKILFFNKTHNNNYDSEKPVFDSTYPDQ